MPAPKNPDTTAATAARRRSGQETMARKLRETGWVCVPPEKAIAREQIRDVLEEEIAEWLSKRPTVNMRFEYNVHKLAEALSWKIELPS